MKRSNVGPWLLAVSFLSGFMACVMAMPQSFSEFFAAFGFCFLFWGSMLMGMLYE